MPKRVLMAAILALALAAPLGATAGGDPGCTTPCARRGQTRSASWVFEIPDFKQSIDAAFHRDTHVSAAGVVEHTTREFGFSYTSMWGSFACTADPANLTFTLNDNGALDVAVAAGDACLGSLTFHWVPNAAGATTDSPIVGTAPPGVEVGKHTTWPADVTYTIPGWGDFPLGPGTSRLHAYDVKAG